MRDKVDVNCKSSHSLKNKFLPEENFYNTKIGSPNIKQAWKPLTTIIEMQSTQSRPKSGIEGEGELIEDVEFNLCKRIEKLILELAKLRDA